MKGLSAYKVVAGCIISCVVINGCKVGELSGSKELPSIPEAYHGSEADTVNSAKLKWQQFFRDEKLVILIDEALHNNRDVLATLQRIEVARSGVLRNKGALFPSIEGLASAEQYRLALYGADWAGNTDSYLTLNDPLTRDITDLNIGFQSSWEIDIRGKLRNQKRAAASRYLASIEGVNLVVTNLVAEVAGRYYELLALDNQLSVVRETISLQQDALDIVRAQKEAATANSLAVQQFEAQVLNSKALERELMQAVFETENEVNFLLGRFPQPIDRDRARLEGELPMEFHAGLPSELLQNRPDIRQAEAELLASKADVKAAKAAFYPSMNIVANARYNAFHPEYLFISPESIAFNALGGLAAPLINRSAIRADFNQANAQQLQALYNYQEAVLKGYIEVSSELMRIQNLDSVYSYKTQQVTLLTESIETSTELFRTGRATYLEVIMAQQGALEAQLDLTDTRRRQYQSMIGAYRASGGGW